jgi:hypothetical protein
MPFLRLLLQLISSFVKSQMVAWFQVAVAL